MALALVACSLLSLSPVAQAATRDALATPQLQQAAKAKPSLGFVDVNLNFGDVLFNKNYDLFGVVSHNIAGNAFNFEVNPRVALNVGPYAFIGLYGVIGAHSTLALIDAGGMYGGGISVGGKVPIAHKLSLQPEFGAAFIYSSLTSTSKVSAAAWSIHINSEKVYDIRLDGALKLAYHLTPRVSFTFGPYLKGTVPPGRSKLTQAYALFYGAATAVQVNF